MVIAAGGAANTGAMVSAIVIVCVATTELPQESMNDQDLVITAGHVPAGALSVPGTVPAPTQLSVYASEVIAGTSPIH